MKHRPMSVSGAPVSASLSPSDAFVKRFMDFHEHFSLQTITRLEEIYTQDIEFLDPLHRLHGLLALKKHLKMLAKNLQLHHRRYLDTLVGEHCSFLSWELEYSHPRVGGGSPRRLRGTTQIRFTSRVYYQEDSFDLDALLYRGRPVLGRLTALTRRRLLS